MPSPFGLKRIMSTIPITESRNLALLYHLNSEPWLNQQAYSQPSQMSAFKTLGKAEVTLPVCGSTPLTELIGARTSCRNFANAPISIGGLASLLHHTYGTLGLREDGTARMHHRPVPSAGALYPLELYVLVRAVDGLPPGLYHYAAWRHSLELVDTGASMEDFLAELLRQFYVAEASAIVFFTAVFPRTMKKYGPRGYRYILLEAGHAAQNLCLLAAEQKLATLCLGGFRDSAINAKLGLNVAIEGAVYSVAVGHSA